MAILRQHLRHEAGALVSWAVAVILLVLLQTSLYRVLAGSVAAPQLVKALHGLPPQLVQFVGGDLGILNVSGWLGAMDLSGWMTLIVSIWVALAAVSIVAADVDHHTLEFLLALPVRRGRLLLERSLSLLLQLLLLYVAIFLAALVALAWIGVSTSDLRFAESLAVLLLDQAALAGTLVLASLFLREQTYAVLTTVTLAAVFVFIPVFVEPNSALGFVRHLTPFDYQAAGTLMQHGTYPGGQIALAAIWAAAAFGAAWAVFSRQEV